MKDFADIAIRSAREDKGFRLAIFREVLAEVTAAKKALQSAPPTQAETTKPLVTLT
jgi:hypothetical protein